ncbi:oxidoreductase [Herbaspirillum rubrisubalbicans]|jgi:diketogulonate reductase-like aldo/keto reductase|uniref:Oxidoreductase n=2 Tax=Herbaspirillum rubrisubalbicans TaxID=80842 RepID=A0ABX9C1Y5_9BURK|nr:aldo/keto reductase [Herbaspirillum rubrisubalbicans]MCP1575649.1 diketogulonate reductase-like aldo/keto reductase [Herbaspirillum rubrisubalbicans]QJP98972.1 aldo/keto reductase [Herbaspirillum rubrisubalbicans Os34]RAM64462.1 oxidoreductase [Herbaspirillum rubrisubalbicans]RAN45574.1 oxidoreductase [Herbaspirillum rubrisubalbicans]
MKQIPLITLRNGAQVPALGQGTWNMGESGAAAATEVRALQAGIDLGMTLIDTAEMYADGNAERIVGQAISGRRQQVYLVSKVLPHNASQRGTIAACEASLKRLGTDHIELYLLHWRGPHPLAATVEGMEKLVAQGKIGGWGVSNLDSDDIDELLQEPQGSHYLCNQVLYNLSRRGIEYDLLPQALEQGVAIMAYSPIEQGRILKNAALGSVAQRHGVTPAQVALAWVLRQPGVIAIPKAADAAHVQANRACLDLQLTAADLKELDAAFPPPRRKQPLAML